MKKLLKNGAGLAVCFIILLSFSSSFAEEIQPMHCVSHADYSGVVTSQIIIDKTNNGEKWCFVYTKDGTKNPLLKELSLAACSSVLQGYSVEQRKVVINWMNGGLNPMLVER